MPSLERADRRRPTLSLIDVCLPNRNVIAALLVPFLVSCDKLMENMADCRRIERDLRSELGVEASVTTSSVKYWAGRRVTTVKVMVRSVGDAGACDASCERETRAIVHRDFSAEVDTIVISGAASH
jgi:hypothetical protein